MQRIPRPAGPTSRSLPADSGDREAANGAGDTANPAIVAPGWLSYGNGGRKPAQRAEPAVDAVVRNDPRRSSTARPDRALTDVPTEDTDPAPRILVVDDEPTLRETVGYYLRREGFAVEVVDDGAAAIQAARTLHPDLIVLDIMLPTMDGYQVCRTLRAESTVPILLLSARGEEFDRVLGLELGADDYLTKPFALRELVARIRAMLRRSQMPMRGLGGVEAASVDDSDVALRAVAVGDLEIDPARRQATRGGQALALKPKEFDLLLHFARAPTIVHSRETLLRDVWGYDFPIDTRTVDVHVRWLRQKIEGDQDAPQRIETVRGHGYRFVHNG